MNGVGDRGSGPPRAGTAWLNAAAKLSGAGLALLLYLVLARVMEPEAFAVVALVLTWQAVATALSSLSMPLVVVRFVSEYLAENRVACAKGALLFGLFTSGLWSLVLAGGVAAALLGGLLPVAPEAGASILIGCALLVVGVATLVWAGYLQSRKQVVAAELLSNVLRTALALGLVLLLAVREDGPLSAAGALAAYLGASVAALVAVVLWARRFWLPGFRARAAVYEPRLWARTGLAFMLVMVAAAVNERVDLMVMGFIAPGAEVATYAVATRFSQTVIFAVTAIAAVMAPHFVELLPRIREGRAGEASALVRATARTTVVVCLAALLAFTLLGPYFLPLFGAFYESAYEPLILLTLGHLIAALFGPAILVATLSGNSAGAVASLALGILVNVALNVNLVPELGARGAAIATAIAFPLAHWAAWFLVRRRVSVDSSAMGWARP